MTSTGRIFCISISIRFRRRALREVREVALLVRDYLEERRVSSYPKTTGSRGIHIYVPIVRGPLQKEVWTVAKAIAVELAKQHPEAITAEYRVAKRPAGRVLVDYNQNAWGRTLASVYSVRPKPEATVSAPVTWEEMEAGNRRFADFTMDSVPERVAEVRRSVQSRSAETRHDAAWRCCT